MVATLALSVSYSYKSFKNVTIRLHCVVQYKLLEDILALITIKTLIKNSIYF